MSETLRHHKTSSMEKAECLPDKSVRQTVLDSLFHPDATIMERLKDRVLQEAEFEPQTQEFHIIQNHKDGGTVYQLLSGETDGDRLPAISALLPKLRQDYQSHDQSIFSCILHRSRPAHISGEADPLPFSDAKLLHDTFRKLDLPLSYLQIADGSPATIQSYTFRDSSSGHPYRFELVAHCLTKQGNWAMALSHLAEARVTSTFWSMDGCIRSDVLTDDLRAFQDYACHPMLLPCIMFAATFRGAVQRRHSIKERLKRLEKAMARMTEQSLSHTGLYYSLDHPDGEPEDMGPLFGLLQSCRKDQTSRKGRNDFWTSFHEAIVDGFQYTEKILAVSPDRQLLIAHDELQHWAAIVWQRLKSLNERDKDHINRLDNLSHMLYNFVQQRDMRLQFSIAKASQRDSEDMKFIAILGSVFLPASLVATILNVPEFQFLQGANLFAAYLAITIPFIVLVIIICFTRPHWRRWTPKLRRLDFPLRTSGE